MTAESADDKPATAPVDSLRDLESLRDRSDVPFHEETEIVEREPFEALDRLDNMAVVGVTNDSGAVLVIRVTEDCELKVPTASVSPDEDYAAAARNWVDTQTGLTITLDAIEGVWTYEVRLENAERTATRSFVVFSASPAADERGVGDPGDEERAEAIGWFDELPDEAVEPPGSRLFFD